jgi:hypothetical protein
MSKPEWQPNVPSAIHGGLAYLRVLAAQESGGEGNLDVWSEVYGNVALEVDKASANQGLLSGNPVVAYAAFLDAMRKSFTNTMSTWTEAHGQLELHLVKLLASATDRSVEQVLDDLDAWAAQLED